MTSFDPRAWNIFAGLCLASSCSSRTIGVDDGGTGNGTDASETETTTQGSETDTAPTTFETLTTFEDDGPECEVDDDCSPGYYCLDGVCEYIPAPDGNWYTECYSDADCEPLEVCDYYYCEYLLSPAPCRPVDPDGIQAIPIASLALTFADVQGDGSEELVVATQSEIHVVDSEGGEIVSPREIDSDSIDAIVAGPFDMTPGDDVMILVADELHLYVSDGMGNLAAPIVTPTGLPGSIGAIAGEFDGAPPADVLIWGSSGALVSLGSGEILDLSSGDFSNASARSVDEPLPGFVLQRDEILDWFTTAGNADGSSHLRGTAPIALTSIDHFGDSFDLSSSLIMSQAAKQHWSLIEEWWPENNNEADISWGVIGRVTALAGGDFDGETPADVGLIVNGTVQIQSRVLTDMSCLSLYPFASIAADLAVGDHDGDGDDELAIRFEPGQVAVVDGE